MLQRGLAESKKRASSSEASKAAARMYATLAAHHIHIALQNCDDKRRAQELFEEATICLNDAERRHASDDSIGIRKGKK